MTKEEGSVLNNVVQVVGATRIRIDSERTAEDAIRRASAARSTDATNMNAVSSRSHSIFSLHITGVHTEGERLLGSLHLVDLAGSERLARSGAEGSRQKETCAINRSLSSLGDIFQVLIPRDDQALPCFVAIINLSPREHERLPKRGAAPGEPPFGGPRR
jgi:hypothetical protein